MRCRASPCTAAAAADRSAAASAPATLATAQADAKALVELAQALIDGDERETPRVAAQPEALLHPPQPLSAEAAAASDSGESAAPTPRPTTLSFEPTASGAASGRQARTLTHR
jgi:hypothetical protein